MPPRVLPFTQSISRSEHNFLSRNLARNPLVGNSAGTRPIKNQLYVFQPPVWRLGTPGYLFCADIRWSDYPDKNRGLLLSIMNLMKPDNGAWHYFRELWEFTWCIHHGLLLMLSVHTLIRMRQVPKAELDERFSFNGGTSRRIFIACGLSGSRLVLFFNVSTIKYHFLYCVATSMLWISVPCLCSSDDRRICSQHHCNA